MATPVGYEQPPQFEISDLSMQPSDPAWPDAVLLVQTYWKQATAMIPQQRQIYLRFLNDPDLASALGNKHHNKSLLHESRDEEGRGLRPALSWARYLVAATLRDDLPKWYTRAIEKAYGSLAINDFTRSYRRIYPAPKEAEAVIKTTSTSQQTNAISGQKHVNSIVQSSHQQQNATPTQKEVNNVPVAASQKHNVTSSQKGNAINPTATSIEVQCLGALLPEDFEKQVLASYQETHTPAQSKTVSPSPTVTQQQDTTPTHNKVDTLSALVIQQENNPCAGTQLAPTSPKIVQPVESEAWDISNVVDMLGQVKKKRLSSAPESSPKRVKANDDDLLLRLNLKTIITQKSVDQLRAIVEGQGARLEEVYATAEQNKQTLSEVRSELRQFMSAVASTLRDIQERLEE